MAAENAKADALRRMAVLFQGIVEAADDYDKIGSFKDAIRNLEAQCDEVRAQKQAVEAELAQARTLVHQTNEQVARSIGDANAHAKRILEDAEIAAESHLAEAQTRIESLQAEMEEQVRQATAVQRQALEQTKLAEAKMRAQIEDLQTKKAELELEFKGKKDLLDQVEAQLAKLDALRRR